MKINKEEYNNKLLHTIKHIEKLILIYQTVIKLVVQDYTDKMLICAILRKDPYTLQSGDITYFKNGFHWHFPYIFLHKEIQEIHIIPRVKELVNEQQLFKNVYENSGDAIDKACCSVPWLLYGSSKSEDMDSYQ